MKCWQSCKQIFLKVLKPRMMIFYKIKMRRRKKKNLIKTLLIKEKSKLREKEKRKIAKKCLFESPDD